MVVIENVKVIGSGSPADPFRVDLPTAAMIGPIRPNAQADTPPVSRRVDIEVPDDEAEEIGNSGKFRLVKEKIKKKYRNQKKWDNDDPLDI